MINRCKCDHWINLLLFECDRCTRLVKGEERYLLMDFFYCRACFITITHDPDYNIFLERIKILSQLPRFEN